jgi:hypothetical protein
MRGMKFNLCSQLWNAPYKSGTEVTLFPCSLFLCVSEFALAYAQVDNLHSSKMWIFAASETSLPTISPFHMHIYVAFLPSENICHRESSCFYILFCCLIPFNIAHVWSVVAGSVWRLTTIKTPMDRCRILLGSRTLNSPYISNLFCTSL